MIDSLGMSGVALRLPEQMAAALNGTLSADFDILPRVPGISNVCVAGMGGSGIAGDLLGSLVADECPVPVSVIKSYRLPRYVDEYTFLMVVSFSGNTEETLEVMHAGHEAGAKMLAVSTGGMVSKLALQWGVPWVEVDSDIPQPRAAIGALSVPLVVALERVGIVQGAVDKLRGAIAHLERRREQFLSDPAPVEAIAGKLLGHIPLIWGSDGLASAAAVRLRSQLNENAKVMAISSVVPELCHNELAGWGQLGDITRQLVTVVALRHAGEHEQVKRRFEFLRDVVSESVSDIVELWAGGDTDVSRLFDLIFAGDMVSLAVARLEQIDPGPVPILDQMKAFTQASPDRLS
ncbi:MAG: bifunctional phosphoglucose/phosphomannose isomerase [Actinobacteria bacterium]|nr:bifunctional phosphoglucose/phosphomannose isomerase [Actinomycetota bacterium]MCL5446738.1 bifunctional phosphoglucose/phosphomannose isomerase [Actinomycetota bacterium]